MKAIFLFVITAFCLTACKKSGYMTSSPASFTLNFTVNGANNGLLTYQSNTTNPVVRFNFSSPVQASGLNTNFTYVNSDHTSVPFSLTLENNDSVVIIQPTNPLKGFSTYILTVSPGLLSVGKGYLVNPVTINIKTAIDSTDKFPLISDSALLTLVEQQTFKYFYDFGHPVSGLALERNTSGDIVTTGGSGFGVMALLVGIQRNFISRAEGLARCNKIVYFLTNQAQRYHGAFPHWMNGTTGTTVPFNDNDNGADLVETSYLMQGLLTARQFFNSNDPAEILLRSSINNLWNGVEWKWFRQNGQNVLYWHWSPNLNFLINMPINGWNEALIVYALAASSPVDSNRVPPIVYSSGWGLNGGIKNGKSFYGIPLPLGPDWGGPLFFAHYSFLGINPNSLSDAYADYRLQNRNHTLINFNYCVSNPGNYTGYSSVCWGLTASDDNISGYSAHSPTNDLGVITPSAAISSLPYTPTQSMNALRFFYYKLGDKIWGPYGFADAFNLTNVWFANSYLAIDQGPEIIMIENYRSGLLWNLFMSCPEIKMGMKSLGFISPNLN